MSTTDGGMKQQRKSASSFTIPLSHAPFKFALQPTDSDMMPKRDHERDVELDKKIEALRRKNEALMKRYKEVEEDKKRAEEEGMALQSRKGKADDLTITISKSTSDSRVVMTKPFSSSSPAGKGQQEAVPDKGGKALHRAPAEATGNS
ncbi:hypothetical protein INR49_014251 [Caranx melampygus]|nr:hypothetical protein INR49_014251 [Caranx melampygus]